jgi:hypothetical protein
MGANGQLGDSSADGAVLRWPGRVLAAEDLRRALNGHREVHLIPGAVVTPLAHEQLRTNGIAVNRPAPAVPTQQPARWGYAQDHPDPSVSSAVQAVQREGLAIDELKPSGPAASPCEWARSLAACVARGECRGGVVFCQDPGMVCCVANKVPGLRATAAASVAQAARAALSLGANVVAVEMPGRTFFEVRQILRTLCMAPDPVCPAGLACTLQELDGHAHR